MKCEYCGEQFVGSKFHHENCQQCGAPKPEPQPEPLGFYMDKPIYDPFEWYAIMSNDSRNCIGLLSLNYWR